MDSREEIQSLYARGPNVFAAFMALVWIAAIVFLYFVVNFIYDASTHPAGWNSLSNFQKFKYPFDHLTTLAKIDTAGALGSIALTTNIYFLCRNRSWYSQLQPDKGRLRMLFIDLHPVFTMLLGFAVVYYVGNTLWHLSFITGFFWVFALWDLCIWNFPMNPGQLSDEFKEKVKYWFLYVDLPTPLFFWLLYCATMTKEMNVPLQDAFISGTIGTVLLIHVYNWFLDGLRMGRLRDRAINWTEIRIVQWISLRFRR
jgi:hypothetical protein